MNESITEVATTTRVVRPPIVCCPTCVATFPVPLNERLLERQSGKDSSVLVSIAARRTPSAQLAPDDEARKIDGSEQFQIAPDDYERSLHRAYCLRQPSPRFCVGQRDEVRHCTLLKQFSSVRPDSKRARKRSCSHALS